MIYLKMKKKKRPFNLRQFNNRIKREMEAEKQALINVKTSALIVNAVINHYKLIDDEIFKVTRKREIVFSRQVAMYFLKKYTVLSLAEIGKIFNGKDHATVLYSAKTVENLMQSDKNIKQDIKLLKDEIDIQLNALYQIKTPANNKYYFVDLNNFVSIKIDNERSFIISGYSDDQVDEIVSKLGLQEYKARKHVNKKQYIIESNDDTDTRDNASNKC